MITQLVVQENDWISASLLDTNQVFMLLEGYLF